MRGGRAFHEAALKEGSQAPPPPPKRQEIFSGFCFCIFFIEPFATAFVVAKQTPAS
jgi:hypothetical protein